MSAAARERNIDAADPFAEKAAHGARHVEFASWLIATFGVDAMRAGVGVLDVAGGRGHLTFELHCRSAVPCTLIEPREVKLSAHQRKLLRKHPNASAGGAFAHFRTTSDEFATTAEGAALLARCSLIVGMHPDLATEPIVDLALAFNKPFAVLPCCVFPFAFPARRLASGGPVTTFDAFVDYLMQKRPDLERAYLNFEGRNKVVFWRGPAARQPEATPSNGRELSAADGAACEPAAGDASACIECSSVDLRTSVV